MLQSNSKLRDPNPAQHCTCMKAEDKILWCKTKNHCYFTQANRKCSYLHEHVIDPSHSMGCSNILLPVPLVQQRTTVCFPLFLWEVFPWLDNSIYYLRKRAHPDHLCCLFWFKGFCFCKPTTNNKPQYSGRTTIFNSFGFECWGRKYVFLNDEIIYILREEI